MNTHDTVYNWLTVKVVSDSFPDDGAANETRMLFEKILKEEHEINNLNYEVCDDMYIVTCVKADSNQSFRFPVPLVESLLSTIKETQKTT